MIFNLFVGLKSRSGINTHADAMKRKIMLEQQFPGSRYTVGKDDQGALPEAFEVRRFEVQ